MYSVKLHACSQSFRKKEVNFHHTFYSNRTDQIPHSSPVVKTTEVFSSHLQCTFFSFFVFFFFVSLLFVFILFFLIVFIPPVNWFMIQETSMQSSIWYTLYTKLWVDPSNCALCNLCVPNLGLRPLFISALALSDQQLQHTLHPKAYRSLHQQLPICLYTQINPSFFSLCVLKLTRCMKSSICRNGTTEELIKLAFIHHAKRCQFKIKSVGCLALDKVKRSNVYLNKPLCLCTHSVSVLLWRRKVTLTLSRQWEKETVCVLSLIHIWRCRRWP